jgi:hypothetical protein
MLAVRKREQKAVKTEIRRKRVIIRSDPKLETMESVLV